MASVWGYSWGSAWGDAWGAIVAGVTQNQGAGSNKKPRRIHPRYIYEPADEAPEVVAKAKKRVIRVPGAEFPAIDRAEISRQVAEVLKQVLAEFDDEDDEEVLLLL